VLIPAYLAPIRQFLPDWERDLGLGSTDRRNPILRHAGHSSDGARPIRTADLLGAMHEGRLTRSREKRLMCSAFVTVDERPPGSIYERICSDMKGVRHFWREVPEIRRGGWNSAGATCRRISAIAMGMAKTRQAEKQTPPLSGWRRQGLLAQHRLQILHRGRGPRSRPAPRWR
jgi:hypothetical protein